MSILTLLEQGKEIRSEIRNKFKTLSLEERLKLVLSMKNIYVLSDSLTNSLYIPQAFSTESLNTVLCHPERHERYDLLYFVTDILNKYSELYSEFDAVSTTKLADVISKDKNFLENEPAAQVLIYMVENSLGSFCYDW